MRKEFVRIDVLGEWSSPDEKLSFRGERIADSKSAKRAFLAVEVASNEPCEVYVVFQDWRDNIVIPSYISRSFEVSHILRSLGFSNFYKI